jgi:hypothetical protein
VRIPRGPFRRSGRIRFEQLEQTLHRWLQLCFQRWSDRRAGMTRARRVSGLPPLDGAAHAGCMDIGDDASYGSVLRPRKPRQMGTRKRSLREAALRQAPLGMIHHHR